MTNLCKKYNFNISAFVVLLCVISTLLKLEIMGLETTAEREVA